MTGIDSLSRLYSTLLARGERLRRSGRESRSGDIARHPEQVPGKTALKDVVRTRLASLPPGADRSREACRILVESTLVWQFGEAFVNSGHAQDLVNEIQATLMTDEEYQKLLDELLSKE